MKFRVCVHQALDAQCSPLSCILRQAAMLKRFAIRLHHIIAMDFFDGGSWVFGDGPLPLAGEAVHAKPPLNRDNRALCGLQQCDH